MSSSRRASSALPKALSPSVSLGLSSLLLGNESRIAQMLGESPSSDLLLALRKVLAVNGISPEQLLSTYFDAGMLSKYCEEKCGKSGKGSALTLASRISSCWSNPSFAPLNSSAPAPNPHAT